jgi:hypothetical protein
MNYQHIKSELRAGPYNWPGGYPRYFVAWDGEALCFKCVRDNYRLVYSESKFREGQWCVLAVATNWEDPHLYCAHCNERIPSAYAEE